MRRRQLIGLLVCVGLCAFVASPVLGNALILNVPDWNQPLNYGPPPPGGSYPCWCAPSAGANIMGYWEDVNGKAGLTDGQAEPLPNPPVYPGNVGTWQQNLFLDGSIEMGWFMDTGKWASTPLGFPPNAGVTAFANINPGLTTFAQTGWVDPSVGGLTKTPYLATVTTDFWGDPTQTLANIWTTYKSEIDASRPVECSFDLWVIPDPNGQTGQSWVVNGQNVWEYKWNPQSTEAHCVAGVGYIDVNPAALGIDDDWFIVQDNWPNTTQYVAVPVVNPVLGAGWGQPAGQPTVWRQNDYVTIGDKITHTFIPEPASAVLLLLSLGGLRAYARRRRLGV